MRLADLIHGFDIRIAGSAGGAGEAGDAAGDVRICDLTEDSRTVMPGSLFIARRGEKADGRRFIKPAIDAGAVAVLVDDAALSLPDLPRGHERVVLLQTGDIQLACAQLAERFFGEPSSRLTMIGVTGTKGKTTTTYLIHQILNSLGVRCGLIGTVCIDDGVEIAPASLTTPPALEVSQMLSRMVEAGCQACVMEVSSHSLHQRRVAGRGGVGFRAGVFTNLSGDHLDYHGTMENYAAAKAMLFESLPDAAHGGVAVVNIGDPAHSRMVQDCRAAIVRCALDSPLAVRGGGHSPQTLRTARVAAVGPAWTDVEFIGFDATAGRSTGGGRHLCRVPLVGEFNVINALEAVTVVHELFGGAGEDDFSFSIIADALSRAAAPPGRLELVSDERSPVTVLVDYAHTDDALRNVLKTLRDARDRWFVGDRAVGGQIRCVFGCGGDRDRTKRPRMGRVAAELADQIVITSDNPRTEQPEAIISEILAGIPTEAQPRVTIEPDRERAIHAAISAAHPGDVVMIAGKGHETYQILPDPHRPGQTITRDFDDREVARAAMRSRGLLPRTPPAARPAVDESAVELEADEGSLGGAGPADNPGSAPARRGG